MSEEEKPEAPEEEEEEAEEEAAEAIEGSQEEATEEAPEEEPEEEEARYENAVNKGDFIMVEMTGRADETGEIIETTDEELAREEGVYDEGRTYGPRLVIVGDGYVLRGLDQRLPGVPFDEETDIEIPAAEAFGERNPDNVQTIPYRMLRSKGFNPVIGAELEIDGRQAIVRSVGAGRVQVDYNHPLAGRKIVYKLRVTENVTDEKKKMEALIGRRFLGIDTGEFKLRKTKKKLRIGVSDQVFFGENIQIAKRGVALDILRYFEELDEVEFYETIKRS
ncbi:MAG TPA: FKBP-type peptidyl-prolyl cis-trans isomerase [Candidatus Krumholzibacteriaceae bacterium]|nr:FKBP-type peptidyl-prolyl cis-trans isomerase [Candidatus Krumholzibacteriaceae bacterium]